MKDLIFLASTTQSVDADDPITLPIILRRRGCAIESFGAGAILRKAGYYKVSGTVTLTTPTAGTAIVQLQKSGVDVQGISASVTTSGTSATTDVNTLSFSGIVRVYCGEVNPVITLLNEGVAISVSSASLEAEYYA